MTKGQRYYYECPLMTCRVHADLPLAPSQAPWCNQDSHNKEMVFVPEKSTGTPPYMEKKAKK